MLSARILLTNEIHQERLNGVSCAGNTNQECLGPRQLLNILSIDSDAFKDELSLQDVTNPKTITTSTHLAYVIYTSGTTGKSKGVMIEHRGLVNLNSALVIRYAIDDGNGKEVILQFFNYVFDVSVEQIILALLNGHVLILVPSQIWLHKEKILKYLILNKVTHISVAPRILELQNFSEISGLRRIVSGSEILSEQSYNKIRFNNNICIINAFGPTETTVTSLVNVIREGAINIGSPLSNTRCYVLAKNLVPVPVAATGELYIGGAGLARGYFNRPDLTAERFIANPFRTEEEIISGMNSRLYKSGDLVRWLANGNLEYIERIDIRVKIRGYRVELGEIASALLGYKGIKQSAALAKEHRNFGSESSGNTYLVGYYVSDIKLDEEAIFRHVASKLPEYMLPTILIHINELPLTINGKLDRKALPDPEFTSHDNYVVPRNEIEEKACQIWAEVLGLNADKVGTYDDFFRLGGDSIISIQLVSRFRKMLQLSVSVKDVFSYKSIARLYENVLSKILSTDGVSSLQTEQGMLVGAVPLLPIQEWFFWRSFSDAHHWNQLQGCLDGLVQHHDCFRFRYKKDGRSNTYEQYCNGHAKIKPLRVFDISTLGYQENSQAFKTNLQVLFTDWQANFDLKDGPVYSFSYIYGYQDGSARIHLALHHLIVDAVSWRIMSEDLRYLYYGKILGSKGSSYCQWAKKVKEYPSEHQEEKAYWVNILSDYDSRLLNTLRVSETTFNVTSAELSREYNRLLLQECNKSYHTQIIDLLLTALGYSLTKITGSNINHVLLESHGREEIDSCMDITRTLGWFTSMYPVRLEIVDALGTSIRSIKESFGTIPNKGVGFGLIFGYKSNALPGISFNYLGQFGQEKIEKIKHENFWQIVGEDGGIPVSTPNWDTNIISLNSLIMDGRFKFSVLKGTSTQKNKLS